MTEGSGTVIHDACNGYDGVFSSGVYWAQDQEGPYLQFSSGNGPRLEMNHKQLSENTKLTVELRMQATGSGQGCVISQMLKPNASVGAQRWMLKFEGQQLEVWGETGSDVTPKSLPGGLPNGNYTWTHVTFQIDGNQVLIYYDGALVAAGTLEFPQTLRSLAAITEIGSCERIFGFGGRIQYVRISRGIRNDFLLTRSP